MNAQAKCLKCGAPLAEESRRAAAVVLELDEAAFALPTRCPPWDVKALLGHLYRDVDRIPEYRDLPAGAPDTDGVTYWRRYDPFGDAPECGVTYRARGGLGRPAGTGVPPDRGRGARRGGRPP